MTDWDTQRSSTAQTTEAKCKISGYWDTEILHLGSL